MAARIAAAKRRLDPSPVNRQIGRILEQNQRAAARFEVRLQDADCPAGLLLIETKPSFDAWADLSEGAYLLRSNIADWSDGRLWKAYIQLTQAEGAGRRAAGRVPTLLSFAVSISAPQRHRPDRTLHCVVIDFHAAVAREHTDHVFPAYWENLRTSGTA